MKSMANLSSRRTRQASAPSDEPPTRSSPQPPKPQSKPNEVSDQLSVWSSHHAVLYGNEPPAASVTVTVVTATGLPTAEPTWVCMVSGASAETSSLPSSQPLTLPVHDVTSDVLLLLCDGAATARRCIGRVVLPLADLLPLNPCGAAPEPLQVWARVFPPAPDGTMRSSPLLTPAIDGVPGSGMAMSPASQPVPLALVRIELSLHASLPSAYLLSPPFDAVAATDARAPSRGEAATLVTPERTVAAAHRLIDALSTAPALIRLSKTHPWTSGLAILLLAGWLCFACAPPALPWWLFTAWILNGASCRLLSRTPSPWEPQHAGGGGGVRAMGDASSAEARRARLEAALLPIVMAAEGLASTCERLSSVAAMNDPRAAALTLIAAVIAATIASVILGVLWVAAAAVGGGPAAVFCSVALAVVLNAMSHHRAELYAWLGARGETDDDADDGPSGRPRGVTFAARAISTSHVVADLVNPADAMDSMGSCWRQLESITANVFRRVPDARMQAHRAMARAALQVEGGKAGGGASAEMV